MDSKHPKIYSLAHERIRELISKDVSIMARSYMRLYPLAVKHVEGAVVEDLAGNLFIDMTAGLNTLPIGGSHPRLLEALKKQVDKLPTYSLRATYSEEAIELIEELSKLTPIRGDIRAILTNSGSEAVEAAVRAVGWHTGKRITVSFLGAYHGTTYAASNLSADSSLRRMGIGLNDVVFAPNPYCHRCPFRLRPETCGLRCLTYLERIIDRIDPQNISSAFFEPIQVEGGLIIPPDDYPQKFMESIKRKRILLVLDEASTAPGRTGRWFAADRWKMDADMICLGPQLASGLPLGILIARGDLLDLEPEMFRSSTGGCQLSIVSALTTLRVIREENLVERAERLGRGLLGRLRDLVDEIELVGDARGIGLLAGIELERDGEPDERSARILVKECFRAGLLIWRRSSTILFTPPLNIEEELLESGLEIFEVKLREVAKLQAVK